MENRLRAALGRLFQSLASGKLVRRRRKLLNGTTTAERSEVFSLAKAKGIWAWRVQGALVLVLMLAAVLGGCGGSEGGGNEEGGGDNADRGNRGGGTAAEEPRITELSEIVSASDKGALAGRRVRIPEVNVLEVVNNRSLFVGASEEERLFVAERRTPPRLGETTGGLEEQDQQRGQRFEEGQTIELAGAIRPVPETADEALRRFGLEGEQFELVQEEEVFIRANRAEAVGGG